MHVPLTPIRCLVRPLDLYAQKTGVSSGDCRSDETDVEGTHWASTMLSLAFLPDYRQTGSARVFQHPRD